MTWLLASHFCVATIRGRHLFHWKARRHQYVQAIQRQQLEAGIVQSLSSAVSHRKELYNTNSPSASLVTIVRIIRMCACTACCCSYYSRAGCSRRNSVPPHYGVCKTCCCCSWYCLPKTSLLKR